MMALKVFYGTEPLYHSSQKILKAPYVKYLRRYRLYSTLPLYHSSQNVLTASYIQYLGRGALLPSRRGLYKPKLVYLRYPCLKNDRKMFR